MTRVSCKLVVPIWTIGSLSFGRVNIQRGIGRANREQLSHFVAQAPHADWEGGITQGIDCVWMEVHPLVYFRGLAIFIMRVACFNCALLIPLINCGAFVAFHSPLDGGAANQQEFQWPREKSTEHVDRG